MRKVVGQVTEVEKNDIRKLHSREKALYELLIAILAPAIAYVSLTVGMVVQEYVTINLILSV